MLFITKKASPFQDLPINMDHSVAPATRTPRNLGFTLDNQLHFAANITATSRSCRFRLYNIRRIRLFPSPRRSPRLGDQVGPGSCHLAPRTSCWYACMCHSSPAAHPECGIPGWSTTFLSSPTLREAVHYAAGLPNGLLLPQYIFCCPGSTMVGRPPH